MMKNTMSHRRSAFIVLLDEQGVAMITSIMLMIVMTILGIAAITITGMEGRMAGFGRASEASVTAAESCLNTSVQIIQQALDVDSGGTLPDAFKSNLGGPVPELNHPTLNEELFGQPNGLGTMMTNHADDPSVDPNLVLNLNNYTVNGDIDRLYVQPKPGTSQAFDEAATGNTDIIYRINCLATNNATGTFTRLSGVYSCTFTSEGCQKAL